MAIVIFAGGNAFLTNNLPHKHDTRCQWLPEVYENDWFVLGYSWIKSKHTWSKNIKTYSLGGHYEIAVENYDPNAEGQFKDMYS